MILNDTFTSRFSTVWGKQKGEFLLKLGRLWDDMMIGVCKRCESQNYALVECTLKQALGQSVVSDAFLKTAKTIHGATEHALAHQSHTVLSAA